MNERDAMNEKNQREFYQLLTLFMVRKLRISIVHPVRTKNGELLSSPDDITERWVEHFDEFLNQPIDIDWPSAQPLKSLTSPLP